MKKILNTIKKIISYILIALIAILATVLIYINICNTIILNKENVLNMIDNSSYYIEVKNNIIKNLTSYLEPSGLDKSLLEKAIKEEQIKKDIYKIIEGIYEGKEIDNTEISLKIQNGIYEYIEENNIKLDVRQKNNIKDISNLISQKYTENIFPNEIINHLNTGLNTINELYKIVNISFIITLIICIIFLIIINLKKSLLYVSLSFLTMSILNFGLYKYIDTTLNLKDIYVYNVSITNILNLIIKNISSNIYTYSGVIFAISIILCYVACFNIYGKNKEEKI